LILRKGCGPSLTQSFERYSQRMEKQSSEMVHISLALHVSSVCDTL
jgi:hypothetical protein